MNLTRMQKRYLWLMGSFPHLLAVQGRGKRTDHLLYAIDDDAGELVIFGYGTPCYFMHTRGLVRPGQAPHSWNLTDEGEAAFTRLLGAGGVYSSDFREVRLKVARHPPR